MRTSVTRNPAADAATIHSVADERGYELRGILTVDANTEMPTVLTVFTVLEYAVAAVIVPALSHLDGKERVITLACDVVTPRVTLPRSAWN
ncbi:hypothetical protein [Nocardia sp. NPDC058633]|uniref:hypothetical protein n=1 Tax=Nocardia sp. NPDC058633 TaxID=3346568 RepID=UPI003664F7C4